MTDPTLRALRSVALAASVLVLGLCSLPPRAWSGSLGVYESSQSPGSFLILPGPVVAQLIDVRFDAASGEGGGIFGMSEVSIFATGGVTIDATGFSCQLAGCMVNPEVFTGGTSFALTGGDDLNGQFGLGDSMATIRISGDSGYLAIASGEYMDASGAASSIGAVRDITPTILARVPEPGFGTALALGVLGIAWRTRRSRACGSARSD